MFRLLFAALSAPLLAFAAPALQKRTPGRATYYAVGLGACGQYNVPSDFIVALNQPQFETGGYPSTQCFRGITINYNGKSAHATVMDECPSGGCSYGDLDMSEGLFTFFEPTSTGVFYMDWSFDGDNSGGGNNNPQPQPQTTTQQQWQPETTSTPQWTPPAPSTTSTSIYVPPPATSSSSQQMISEQAYDPSSSAAPEPTPNAWSGGVADGANKLLGQFANLMIAAGGA